MKRSLYVVMGIVWLAMALGGAYYSVRGAWGQQSLRLYPANYRLCEYAAQAAYEHAFKAGVSNAVELKATARFWCERGLALNDHSLYLRWLKSQLLWAEDPAAAIANWAEYTDWHFWDAYNHAQLCEMYARVGRFPEAEAEFRWVTGSAYEGDTRKTLASEKKARELD